MSPPACRACPLGSCPFAPRRRVPGEVLHVEGGEATHVWYVRRGQVVRRRRGEAAHGDSRLQGAGTFLGLEALTGAPYRATARVVDDAVICRTSRQAFEAWIGPRGAPARTVLESITAEGDTAEAPGRLVGPAVARVARWLLAAGAPPHGLKRHVLAELLQMTPETLSRALARLAARGAIVSTRRSIEIADREALAAIRG